MSAHMAPSGKSRGARGAELLEGLLDDENATESPSNPLRASARSFYKKEKNSGGGQQDAGEAADGAKTGKVARFAENDDVEEGDEAGQAAEGSGPSGSGGWKSAEAMEQSGGGNFEERKFHLPVWMLKQRQGGEDGYINLESLDCDEANTPFNVDTKRALKDTVNQDNQVVFTSVDFYRWVLVMIIAVSIAFVTRFIQISKDMLIDSRNAVVQLEFDAGGTFWSSFGFFASWNLICVLIAAVVTTFVEPASAADGVAEIKAYLNGTRVTGFLSVRTITCKIFCTILAASASLASGVEAPLIHIGAGIASGVTRGDKLKNSVLDFAPKILGKFHNDRDRRAFISAGAGAGMAAAFGAPIGGVLFILEETASHWSPSLVWRIFTACLMTTMVLSMIEAGGQGGDISLTGLLSIGTHNNVGRDRSLVALKNTSVIAAIYWWEVIFFILVGSLAGMCGGLFNRAVEGLNHARNKFLRGRRFLRVLEALLISLGTSVLMTELAHHSGTSGCRVNGAWTCGNATNWGEWCTGAEDTSTCNGTGAFCTNATVWVCDGGIVSGSTCSNTDCVDMNGTCVPHSIDQGASAGLRLSCAEGEYHELATILIGHHERALDKLVSQSWPGAPFSIKTMLIAAFVYLFLMALTWGASLPCGIFLPCALVGGCIGRIIGELAKQHVDDRVFPGSYALAGAGAMLGGVQRATISLVVIMIEGTGNVHGILPVVISTVMANLTAAFFCKEGVYDLGIRQKNLRFLEHEPEFHSQFLVAGDVMSAPVTTLKVVDTVGRILAVLREGVHNGFPVLAQVHDEVVEGEGRFEGLVLRSTLRHLVATRFRDAEDSWEDREDAPLWNTISAEDPRKVPLNGDPRLYRQMETHVKGGSANQSNKDWEWAAFSDADRARYINLGPYMNAACLTVNEALPLHKTLDCLQQMSLRHLPVLDDNHRVRGMITRHNLSRQLLRRSVAAFYHPRDMNIQPHEGRATPRLRKGSAKERIVQQAAREGLPLDFSDVGLAGAPVEDKVVRRSKTLRNWSDFVTTREVLTGGPTYSWQDRLASALAFL